MQQELRETPTGFGRWAFLRRNPIGTHWRLVRAAFTPPYVSECESDFDSTGLKLTPRSIALIGSLRPNVIDLPQNLHFPALRCERVKNIPRGQEVAYTEVVARQCAACAGLKRWPTLH
jgi:hypothetical protein